MGMSAFVHSLRALNRGATCASESGDWIENVSMTRVAFFVLLVVPALFVATWICRKMDLHSDSFYESKAATALYLTAIAFAFVVSELLEEWVGK